MKQISKNDFRRFVYQVYHNMIDNMELSTYLQLPDNFEETGLWRCCMDLIVIHSKKTEIRHNPNGTTSTFNTINSTTLYSGYYYSKEYDEIPYMKGAKKVIDDMYQQYLDQCESFDALQKALWRVTFYSDQMALIDESKPEQPIKI